MSLNTLQDKESKISTIIEEIESISHIEKLFFYVNEQLKSPEYTKKEKKEILQRYKHRLIELAPTFKGSASIDQEKIAKLANIFTDFPIKERIGQGQHDMFRSQETGDLINKYIPEDKKELFVKILSVTSIRTNTASNIDLTFRIYINHLKGKKTPKLFGNVNEQLQKVLNGGEISGDKITNFQNAILGDNSAIVIDSHIARKLFNVGREKELEDGKILKAGLKKIEYLYCELIVREIALEKGFTPNQTSCILQYVGRTENGSKYNSSYYQYFEEKIGAKYKILQKYEGIHTNSENPSGAPQQIQEILQNDRNFEVIYGGEKGREKSDISLKNDKEETQSLLAFCREHKYSPYFAPGNDYHMRTMGPQGTPKGIIYNPDEMNLPGGILSFLHELGECIWYSKAHQYGNKIYASKLSPREKNMEYKKLELKRQIECRYLAIKFGKELQKRGYNIFHGFPTIKDLEYYINRYVGTYLEKAHYKLEKKDCFVDSQKIAEIMNS